MKKQYAARIKQTKPGKQTANASRKKIVKCLGAALLLGVAIILGIIGYFAFSGGALALASCVFIKQIVRFALRCWDERSIIAELTLEIGAVVMRILKRH